MTGITYKEYTVQLKPFLDSVACLEGKISIQCKTNRNRSVKHSIHVYKYTDTNNKVLRLIVIIYARCAGVRIIPALSIEQTTMKLKKIIMSKINKI